MASVVMYVRCIGTWCMTCFITFDDLSDHNNLISLCFSGDTSLPHSVSITIHTDTLAGTLPKSQVSPPTFSLGQHSKTIL